MCVVWLTRAGVIKYYCIEISVQDEKVNASGVDEPGLKEMRKVINKAAAGRSRSSKKDAASSRM